MNVREIILRKQFLDDKLAVVDAYIDSLGPAQVVIKNEIYTKAINIKFELLSKIRSHHILLDNLNRDTILTIDDTEISVYEALHLLDTLQKKMGTFKAVIVGDVSKSLDVFTLLEKLDILFEEYINIYLVVLNSDVSTDWEK